MTKIYCHPTITSLQGFLGPLCLLPVQGVIIRDYLGQMAERIHEGIHTDGTHQSSLYVLFSNYHPAYLGWPEDELARHSFTITDCQYLVAKERGFENWKEVKALGNHRFDPDFEQALQWLLAGEQPALDELLSTSPEPVKKRSVYPHRATLLHYLGSNGVELWRQQVPLNLGVIIRLLIEHGADPAAKMQVYNGEFSTAELLATSAHPREARVLAAALTELEGK